MRVFPLLSTLVALLVLPVAASAQTTTNAPPGNSGISQYVEVVAGGGGGTPSRSVAESKTKLSGSEEAKLKASGKDGEALARLVAQTAPAAPKGTSSAGGSKIDESDKTAGKKAKPSTAAGPSGEVAEVSPQSKGTAIAAAIAGSKDGGTGMGTWLPVLMAAALVTLLAGTLVRRRLRPASGDDESQ